MLGIVILNYNCWDLNIKCINSIRNTTNVKYKIYLVDNCSTIQETQVFLNYINESRDIKYIKCNKNKGYAAGNNVGVRNAVKDGCDYILISNNDVIFSDGSIEGMKSFLESHRDVAVVGPKIYLPSGELQEINMGCKMTLKGKFLYMLRKTPLAFVSRSFVSRFHASDKDKSKPFFVHGVSGCCFMVSSRYTSKLFPLDENTFLYEEENILSYKIEQIGKKVVYDSDVSVVHLGGASTRGMSAFSYMCQVESEIYYCGKCLKANKIPLILFVVLRSIIYVKNYGFNDWNDYIDKIKKKIKTVYRRG